MCGCVSILYRQALGSAYLSGRRHAPTHDFRVGDQHLSQCLSCCESDLSTPRPRPPHVSPHRVTSQCHTCMMAGCTRRDQSGCRRQRRHRRREGGWATQPLAICDRGGVQPPRKQAGGAGRSAAWASVACTSLSAPCTAMPSSSALLAAISASMMRGAPTASSTWFGGRIVQCLPVSSQSHSMD